MNIQEVYLTVTDRLNKISTNNNQSISYHAFVRAFNKSQYAWIENRLKVKESNNIRLEELQQLVETVEIKSNKFQKNPLKISVPFPDNYYRFSRLDAISGSCLLSARLVEESNITELLKNEHFKPSLNWEETLLTISNNNLHVWTNNEFTITSVLLNYYRKPVEVDIKGYVSFTGDSQDINPEFTGSSLHEIIDLTVLTLAADINSEFIYQTTSQRVNSNT